MVNLAKPMISHTLYVIILCYLCLGVMSVKRIENVVLLKVIGSCELLAALAMFYIFSDAVPALMSGVILLGLSANSFYQAHKCYLRQYTPKKDDEANSHN
jgi:hypothetical protein